MTRDEIRALVLALPETEEGTSWGYPSFKAGGKFLTRVRDEDDSIVVYVPSIDERGMLIEAEPQTFHLTDHYRSYPIVSARMRVRVRSDIEVTSTPAMCSSAAGPPSPSGACRRPRMCISVLLPEPDGPIRATISPSPILISTPRSALTWLRRLSRYVFRRLRPSRSGVGAVIIRIAALRPGRAALRSTQG